MGKTIEAYEAIGNLKANGIRLFGRDGKWMKDWDINNTLEVSRVKLEFAIPAENGEPNRFFDVWLSPEQFLKELNGIRRHDSITADVVVVSEGDTVVRTGMDDYKVVHVDQHDVILGLIKNDKISERRNKPFQIKPVKLEKPTESEDDEADE